MTTNYKNLLKDTFSDVTSLTPDKLTNLVDETMKYFATMQEKFNSTEPGMREEALKESLELREVLEKQMTALCESTGLAPSDLARYAEDLGKMTPAEQTVMLQVQEKLKVLKPEVAFKVRKKRRHHLKIVA